MIKKDIFSLLCAFLLGVILTLILNSNSKDTGYVPFVSDGNQINAIYVPFNSDQNQILDTRNGSIYDISNNNGKKWWVQTVPEVGKKWD